MSNQVDRYCLDNTFNVYHNGSYSFIGCYEGIPYYHHNYYDSSIGINDGLYLYFAWSLGI